MYSFVEDNLIERNDNRTHLGKKAVNDEKISQSFLSVLVLQWLYVINNKLPRAVTMKYAAELRNQTIASSRNEISIALPGILNSIEKSSEAKVMRAAFQGGKKFPDSRKGFKGRKQPSKEKPKTPQCPLCKALGRPNTNHSLSTCRQLPEEERRKFYRAMKVEIVEEISHDECGTSEEVEDEAEEEEEVDPRLKGAFRGVDCYKEEVGEVAINLGRVEVMASPTLPVMAGSKKIILTMDSGATANIIRHDAAIYIGAKVQPTHQKVKLADSISHLVILGEVHTTFRYGKYEMKFSGLVAKDLDVDVLAGVPFNHRNGTYTREEHERVYFWDGHSYFYGNDANSRRVGIQTAHMMRAVEASTIWPEETSPYYADVECQQEVPVLIEPNRGSKGSTWVEPQIALCKDGVVEVQNLSAYPVVVKKHDKSVRITPLVEPEELDIQPPQPKKEEKSKVNQPNLEEAVSIDPGEKLPLDVKRDFARINHLYSSEDVPSSSEGLESDRGSTFTPVKAREERPDPGAEMVIPREISEPPNNPGSVQAPPEKMSASTRPTRKKQSTKRLIEEM